jgi:uncharacterized RDD family membrane protein YckC
MLYDLLLLIAVLMVSTAFLLPLTSGEAITPADTGGLAYAYRLFLVAVIVVYFGVSWTRTGQTLGMLAWKLRVIREDGGRLRWRDVIARLAASVLSWAALGLGYLWIIFDPQKRAWHDRLTHTRVVKLEA